jgi:hypothetical protein
VTSGLVLREKITGMAAAGTLLILVGLIISESKFRTGKRGSSPDIDLPDSF